MHISVNWIAATRSCTVIELKLKCETHEEARIYLNAQQYLSLLQDFCEAIRGAKKHGTDRDILHQVEVFYPDLCRAIEHNTGPY